MGGTRVSRLPRGRFLRARPPAAPAGRRIGLLGGSFDPAHAGHVEISLAALKRLRLDRVWWIVTPGNPLKSRTDMAPHAERMTRARALVSDPRIAITGFEADLGSPPYTAGTLAFLVRRFPAARFVWIMGADNLAQLHRWKDWRSIARAMPFAAADRPGWRLKALSAPGARALAGSRLPERRAAGLPSRRPPAWVFLTGRLNPLSSTQLRAATCNNP